MQRYRLKLRALAGMLTGMVALVVLSGCAATPMTAQLTASPPQGLPASVELSDVPFFAQTRFFCGPAALATVLNTTGLMTEPDSLAESVYTPGREGTLQTEIITGTRRQGRLALPLRNLSDAFVNVAQGRPVLILQNLSLDIAPRWHYAVIVGYDLADETVSLRSGTTFRQVMPMKTFEHTWRRSGYWGVVIVGPDGPVLDNTTISEWLQEAYGLERADHVLDALKAYTFAAKHWPDASAPLISAGNILIETNRLHDAKVQLQAAVQREPENPVALNNLAHVLMRLGELEEAEQNALKAVDAGGDTQVTAQETLLEIRAQK
jgi:hypothetical protein